MMSREDEELREKFDFSILLFNVKKDKIAKHLRQRSLFVLHHSWTSSKKSR